MVQLILKLCPSSILKYYIQLHLAFKIVNTQVSKLLKLFKNKTKHFHLHLIKYIGSQLNKF